MINCNLCGNLVVDKFSCSASCKALNCGVHKELSEVVEHIGQPVPRMLPDLGEDKCPGMIEYIADKAIS